MKIIFNSSEKSFGCFIIGLAVLFGVVSLGLMLLKGGVWLSARVLPGLFAFIWFVLAVDLIALLPLGLFKKTKGLSGAGLVLSSYIYGLTLWIWALVLTYSIWGGLAVIIGLFIVGVGVVPIAMLATALTAEWASFGQLLLLIALTFSTRTIGKLFARQAATRAYEEAQGIYTIE